jgi:hypothetical protein
MIFRALLLSLALVTPALADDSRQQTAAPEPDPVTEFRDPQLAQQAGTAPADDLEEERGEGRSFRGAGTSNMLGGGGTSGPGGYASGQDLPEG